MYHLCREKYRLELYWDDVVYRNDQEATIVGAYFCGPVLKDAAKIAAPDFINLDITPQLLTVFDSYYIVRLMWRGVRYCDNKVFLDEAILTNDYLKAMHKFERGDHIIIDTEDHEEKTHPYHLVYKSQVVRKDKEPYKYG